MSEDIIIRKPRRLYPLPSDIRSLNEPWPVDARSRHSRVPIEGDTYAEGYNTGENPMIAPPGGFKSDLLTKL